MPGESAALIAAVAFTGFLLFFTVYTWPKLGAAALVLGMFVLWRPASAIFHRVCSLNMPDFTGYLR